MDVPDRRQRTRQILASYSVSRDRFGDPGSTEMSTADLVNLEGLMQETIRLFRENLADCVRSEREATSRILRRRKSKTDPVELGYAEAKAELNDAIARLTADKMQVRTARNRQATALRIAGNPPSNKASEDQLSSLVDLHSSGVLSADEFAAATARLR